MGVVGQSRESVLGLINNMSIRLNQDFFPL